MPEYSTPLQDVISRAENFVEATRGLELATRTSWARDELIGALAVHDYTTAPLPESPEDTPEACTGPTQVSDLAQAIYDLDRGWARMSVGRGGEITEEISRMINGVVGAAFKAGVIE